MVRGQAGIGDLVQVQASLRTGPRALARSARMLGLELPTSRPDAASPRSSPRPARPPSEARPPDRTPPAAAVPASGPRAVPRLSPVERVPWEMQRPRDPFPAADDSHLRPVLPHRPLLRPSATRDVLEAVSAVWQPGAEPDLAALLAEVLRGRVVTRIPHRPQLSSAAGLQILVDSGDGMQPFRRDQRAVVAALRQVTGPATSVLKFRDDPWLGVGPGRPGGWSRTYRPPPPGCPVLALSTAGCGVRADPGLIPSWLRLHQTLAARQSRLVVLIPVPADRWDLRLRRHLTLVPWDRTTRRRNVAVLDARDDRR